MSREFFIFIIILCGTVLIENKTDAANILGLFTSHHRSHMLVYISVVEELLHRGHNISIVTVLPIQIKPSEALRTIQLNMPPESNRRIGIFRQIEVVVANSRAFDDLHLKRFLGEDNKFDLIIIGYFFNDYQMGLGAHYNCPIVILWTTQPISFVNRFVGNPNGWWYVPHPFVKSQSIGIRGVLHGIFETAYQYVFDIVMNQVYKKHFPSSKYPTLQQMRSNISLILCNHHFSEGLIAAHLPTVVEIGGVQIKDTNELAKNLKEFMDLAEYGVIYFSLGTVVSTKQFPPEVLQIFVKVFSKLPQRILWKIDNIQQNFSNIMVHKWFPQNAVLAHPKTKLFITHAGKGSTIEATYHAVPIIAVPIFGDQFGDAHRLIKSGFGLQLDANTLTEATLYNCISEVLTNNTYAQKIKIASQVYKDRPISAKATAVYWIEYVLRHKGAQHIQIMTKTMNYVQYLNIDVYLFCICTIYASMSAWRLLIFTIYRSDQTLFA